MRGNIITLVYQEGKFNQTDPLFQYDYGQKLILTGLDLPEVYEVHFSNTTIGESKTAIGDSSGVDIPDEYLTTGKNVYFWLFLHTGDADGETVISGMIPVNRRSRPTNEPPTPEQQDVITQTIAALNAAVEQTGQDVTETNAAKEAAEAAQGKAEEARDAAEDWADKAEQAADNAGYMEMEIVDGDLIYTKTEFIETDFVLIDGNLILEVEV